MTKEEHVERHLQLCKRVFERLLREGTLKETLEHFRKSQEEYVANIDSDSSIPRGTQQKSD